MHVLMVLSQGSGWGGKNKCLTGREGTVGLERRLGAVGCAAETKTDPEVIPLLPVSPLGFRFTGLNYKGLKH